MTTPTRKLMLTFSFLEMWERFGFYGMRALLTLFLIKHYGFADKEAFAVYSVYSAICYIIPVLGGFLADKVFGHKKLLLLGAIIICTGHAILSFAIQPWIFYLGLSCVAVGTGFFKGNITSILGSTYGDKNSKERDYGFRIFYIMTNIGAFVSAIVCGIVAKVYGWEYGFGLAGLGMFVGLITLVLSKNLLADHGNQPENHSSDSNPFAFLGKISINIMSNLILVAACGLAFFYIDISLKAISTMGVLVILHFIYIMSKCSSNERLGLAFICIMLFFFTLMFALEMQLGAFVNVFTDRHVNRHVFGMEVPTASLQALNPFSIIVLGGIATILLKKLGQHTLKVFGGGLIMSCLGCVTLFIGCIYYDYHARINIIFLVMSMVFIALSELMMAPIMASFITYMAPKKIRGYMMGFLMLCLSYANLAGILISKYLLKLDRQDEQVGSLNSLVTYQSCFLKIGILFMVASVIYLAIYKFLDNTYKSYN
jgi:POT family proton-dependent oligopeptide transporter